MEQKTPLSFYLRDKKSFVCLNCVLPFECNESSPNCLYHQKVSKTPREIMIDKLIAASKLRSAIKNLGFAKYDKRRKPDTPQRMLWRSYKQRKREITNQEC